MSKPTHIPTTTTTSWLIYCFFQPQKKDLYNNDFDIEPIKTKEPKEVLEAMKTMFKRKYIKKPYASIRTDAGTEFQGVFHKYLFDESMLHRIAIPNRHQQLANVENVNRQLGRLFNGYMNNKEEQTGRVYKNGLML